MKRLLLTVLMLSPAVALAAEDASTPASAADATTAAPDAAAPGSASTEAAAEAPVAPTAVTAATTEPEKLGWGFIGTLSHDLGQGTFIDASRYSSLVGWLTLSPTYAFKVRNIKLSSNARFYVSWEYTLPSNINGRRYDFPYDPQLNLSAPSLFTIPGVAVKVTPALRLSLPLKFESRAAGLIGQVGPAVVLQRSLGKFDLSHVVRFTRSIHSTQYIKLGSTAGRDSAGTYLTLCRAGDDACGSGGVNTAFSLSNWTTAGFNATDKLSFSVEYIFGKSWRYAVTDAPDGYTPKATDVNGNPVARTGSATVDVQSASLGVDYKFTKSTSVSGSIGTEQPPLTYDPQGSGWRARFPFFNFLTPADNYTTFSIGVTTTI